MKDNKKTLCISILLIAIAGIIIYSNSFECPFVFDDKPAIADNYEIRKIENYLSLDNILKPRAIVNLTFALNYKFGKLNVSGYHLVNILIHIINGILVYFLATLIFTRTLTRPSSLHSAEAGRAQSSNHPVNFSTSHLLTFSPSHQLSFISLFAALIFIAHPIQIQAVTYTVQRYASMAAMFYMASVLFYLKARITEVGGQPSTQSYAAPRRSEVRGRKSEDGGQRSLLSAFSSILSLHFLRHVGISQQAEHCKLAGGDSACGIPVC